MCFKQVPGNMQENLSLGTFWVGGRNPNIKNSVSASSRQGSLEKHGFSIFESSKIFPIFLFQLINFTKPIEEDKYPFIYLLDIFCTQ